MSKIGTEKEEIKKEDASMVSFSTAILVWMGLVILTGLAITMAAAIPKDGLNLGHWGVIAVILVAGIQSYLVVRFFMPINHEDRVFKTILSWAVCFLIAVMLYTLVDFPAW